MTRLAEIAFWLGLVLWIAALTSAAVAAMNVFPIMDDLVMTLERFPAWPGDEHGRLAAGIVMEGVFFTVDLIQFVAAPLAVGGVVLRLVLDRTARRRAGTLIPSACVLIAAALLVVHVTWLAPRMNRSLRSFWDAAEAGQLDDARAHRAAFDEDHRIADPLLRTNLLLLLGAVVVAAAGRGAAGDASGTPTLEVPRLAQPGAGS